MGDMMKGFFLLSLAVIGLASAYFAWLFLIPVSETDVEFRIANVCWIGQLAGSALNGKYHRPVSCGCMGEGLSKAMEPAAQAKGAEAMRQLVLTQIERNLAGGTTERMDPAAFAGPAVMRFASALDRLGRDCKIGAFAAR